MSRARASATSGCNLNAALSVLVACALLALPRDAAAQADIAWFFAGAATGLAAHEAGHVLFDEAFAAEPGIRKVSFGGIPFFAITHRPVTARKEFIISSAGFWVQHATDELLLSRQPPLRARHAPFLKGLVAFNTLTSAGYAMAAFARAGPLERDTRGIALSAGVPEPEVGALILGPALLDAWRYYRPDARWAKWGSRAVKIAGVLLAVKSR